LLGDGTGQSDIDLQCKKCMQGIFEVLHVPDASANIVKENRQFVCSDGTAQRVLQVKANA
jgi:hypothetical protein